jgi:molybdopterin-guanine dinucleotide biosynthesis protein A
MGDRFTDVSVFILAGGKSTRMGTDKAFVPLDGRTLLARALDLARQVTSDVHIVGDRTKFAPFAPVVEDIYLGCGPLGGIHAALLSSQSDLNVILAVDTPFVSLALLQHLITRARNCPSVAVTVPRPTGGWQPLCAVYRREFAAAAERSLTQGRYKIDALFEETKTQAIGEQELETAGFSPRIFQNVNTPEDIAALE